MLLCIYIPYCAYTVLGTSRTNRIQTSPVESDLLRCYKGRLSASLDLHCDRVLEEFYAQQLGLPLQLFLVNQTLFCYGSSSRVTVFRRTRPWTLLKSSTHPHILFLQIYFNIIFPSTHRLPKESLPFQAQWLKFCTHFSYPYMFHPPYHIW
jgi:hypothetical protein